MKECKVCSKCGKMKSLDDFHRNRKRGDGKHCWCKSCVAEQNIAYYMTHKIEKAKYNKAYQENHRQELREKRRMNRNDNRINDVLIT